MLTQVCRVGMVAKARSMSLCGLGTHSLTTSQNLNLSVATIPPPLDTVSVTIRSHQHKLCNLSDTYCIPSSGPELFIDR
jgi:hypothetical protein